MASRTRRPRASAQSRTIRQTFGPFRGMRLAAEERASHPDLVDYALNMLPTDPERGGAYVVIPPPVQTSGLKPDNEVRHGYVAFPSQIAATFSVGTYTVTSDGIYWLGANTTAWQRVVSADVLANAGVGLAVNNYKWFFLVFNKHLVVSDGTNTPWMWDGTWNGGITVLSNCPVLWGQPTEYAGKLFGIKASDPRTIVWSEENDATTGYEAGGFNNAWTLGQQADENLTRIYGRNDGLYYWRPHSTGRISGAVAGEFRTTHTHDALSGVVGAIDRSGLVDTGDALWWYSTEERIVRHVIDGAIEDVSPTIFAVGAEQLPPGVEPYWTPSDQPSVALDPQNDTEAVLVGPNSVTARPQVWFSVPKTTPGLPHTRRDNSLILVYDAGTARPLGYLARQPTTGFSGIGRHLSVAMTEINSSTSRPCRVALADNGFQQPLLWSYLPATGARSTLTPTGVLVGPVAGGADEIELTWLRCDVATRMPPKPAAHVTPSTLSLTPTTPGDREGSTLTAEVHPDTALVTTGHVPFGLEHVGRWLRPVFRCVWNSTEQGYGIQGYTLTAAGASEDPDAF